MHFASFQGTVRRVLARRKYIVLLLERMAALRRLQATFRRATQNQKYLLWSKRGKRLAAQAAQALHRSWYCLKQREVVVIQAIIRREFGVPPLETLFGPAEPAPPPPSLEPSREMVPPAETKVSPAQVRWRRPSVITVTDTEQGNTSQGRQGSVYVFEDLPAPADSGTKSSPRVTGQRFCQRGQLHLTCSVCARFANRRSRRRRWGGCLT